MSARFIPRPRRELPAAETPGGRGPRSPSSTRATPQISRSPVRSITGHDLSKDAVLNRFPTTQKWMNHGQKRDGRWRQPGPRHPAAARPTAAGTTGTHHPDRSVGRQVEVAGRDELGTAVVQTAEGAGRFLRLRSPSPTTAPTSPCTPRRPARSWSPSSSTPPGGGSASTAARSASRPVTNFRCHRGGRYQRFSNGMIVWHPSIGAFAVQGSILAKYTALGGSALGLPDHRRDLHEGGVVQPLPQRRHRRRAVDLRHPADRHRRHLRADPGRSGRRWTGNAAHSATPPPTSCRPGSTRTAATPSSSTASSSTTPATAPTPPSARSTPATASSAAPAGATRSPTSPP